VTATNGTEVIAHDEPAGELGGLGGRASKDREPRAVVLHERGAMASSLVEFASIGTLQTVSPRCIGVGHHPMGIDELRVALDGAKPRVVHVPAILVVCNALSANPWDHTFGNAAFRETDRDVPIHAHEEAALWLADQGERMKQRFAESPAHPHGAEMAATEIVIPERTFSHADVLDLGDRVLALAFPGRGHTSGDIVARVADADVLIAGDLIEESAKPWIGMDSWPLEWPETLRRCARVCGREHVGDPRPRGAGRSHVRPGTARRDWPDRTDRPDSRWTRRTCRSCGGRRRVALGSRRPYP
jgi:hypothetical protein